MRVQLAFLALSCVSFGLAQACGGDTGVNIDASSDATVGDSPNNGNDVNTSDVAQQNDTGTADTGTSDASDGGTQTDSGKTGITSWGCGNTTVTDCSLCIGHTQPCVFCETADASVLAGNCVQQGTGCFNGAPTGYQVCGCPSGDAGQCPWPDQVCVSFNGHFCLTCGEFNQTNGLTCENGGKCDAVDGGCL